MNAFGETIRKWRREKELPLRIVASFLSMDPAILSKIERGKRKATRETVLRLADFFKADPGALMVQWLSDGVVYQLRDEEGALEALKAAEATVQYSALNSAAEKSKVIRIIRSYLKKDGRVSRAWLFGSYARGSASRFSDIDLLVTYSDRATGTMLDYADIRKDLELLLQRKVDLVEEGFLRPFARSSFNREKILIYG